MAFDAAYLFQTPSVSTQGAREWTYLTTDAAATVIAGTYITAGYGIKVGDKLRIVQFASAAFTSVTRVTEHYCTATATTGATFSQAVSGGSEVVLSYPALSASGAAAAVARFVAPFTGRIVRIDSVLNGTITTGDLTLTAAISGTNVSGGAITVDVTGAGAGVRDSVTPSLTATSNKFSPGSLITVTAGGTAAGTKTVNLFVLLRQMTTT